MLSSTETTPVHTASQEKAEATPEGTDQSESCTELEVIRWGWSCPAWKHALRCQLSLGADGAPLLPAQHLLCSLCKIRRQWFYASAYQVILCRC